jgi:hypothetical protein
VGYAVTDFLVPRYKAGSTRRYVERPRLSDSGHPKCATHLHSSALGTLLSDSRQVALSEGNGSRRHLVAPKARNASWASSLQTSEPLRGVLRTRRFRRPHVAHNAPRIANLMLHDQFYF